MPIDLVGGGGDSFMHRDAREGEPGISGKGFEKGGGCRSLTLEESASELKEPSRKTASIVTSDRAE